MVRYLLFGNSVSSSDDDEGHAQSAARRVAVHVQPRVDVRRRRRRPAAAAAAAADAGALQVPNLSLIWIRLCRISFQRVQIRWSRFVMTGTDSRFLFLSLVSFFVVVAGKWRGSSRTTCGCAWTSGACRRPWWPSTARRTSPASSPGRYTITQKRKETRATAKTSKVEPA